MTRVCLACRWCCYVMLHADQDGEKLQALLRLLTELLERVRVVEALSTVPQMYCLAVVEVVRRKMFMKHYREVRRSGARFHSNECCGFTVANTNCGVVDIVGLVWSPGSGLCTMLRFFFFFISCSAGRNKNSLVCC